jgi:hypothetical protein
VPGRSAGLAKTRIAVQWKREIRAVRRVRGLIVDQFLLGREQIVKRIDSHDFPRVESIPRQNLIEEVAECATHRAHPSVLKNPS